MIFKIHFAVLNESRKIGFAVLMNLFIVVPFVFGSINHTYKNKKGQPSRLPQSFLSLKSNTMKNYAKVRFFIEPTKYFCYFLLLFIVI